LLRFSLADVFELDSRTIENNIDNVREEFKREIEIILRDRFQDLPNYILKKFKTIFNRGDNGLPINWKQMTPEIIEKRFLEKSKQTQEILIAVKLFDTKRGNLDLDRDAITTDKALENCASKVTEDLRAEYEDAIRKHRASEMANVPKWLWIVLVYFMYDDVLQMLKSPLLFYPTMLILGFVVLCFTIGHGDVPKAVIFGMWHLMKLLLGPYLAKIGINM